VRAARGRAWASVSIVLFDVTIVFQERRLVFKVCPLDPPLLQVHVLQERLLDLLQRI
jgi:hypothetical protein